MSKYLARLLALDSLDALKREMRRLAVDKGGIPIMSAKGLQRLVLVEQVPTAAANCIKQEILARGGDLVTPWSASGFEAPFVDVIFVGNLTTLRSTISKLYRQRVYDLPLIADAVQAVLMHTTPGYLPVAPQPNRQGIVVEETLEDLMGGRIPLQPGTHRATGRPTLVEVPGLPPWRFGELTYVVGEAKAELIERMRTEDPDKVIAARAESAQAAEAALKAGAHMLLGGENPALWPVAAEHGVPMVLAHSREVPVSEDLLSAISRFFAEAMDQAVGAGVREEQIVLDAGFGLGKTDSQNVALIRRLRELTSFGRPLLADPTALADDLPGMAAAVTVCIAGGADMIRIRDVWGLAQCASMTDRLLRGAERPGE